MPRPISAHIHLDAIHHNLATIKGKAAHSRVWAVVKANAYGHGIERIFPALSDADGIALLDLEEAVRVRQLGWVKPILLLEGVFQPADLAVASENSLTFSLHCEDQVRMLRHADRSARFDIQLKMNTGMNRLGFRPDVFRKVWEEVSGLPAVRSVGLMSHFATADEGDIDWQLDVFEAATAGIPGERTLSNSAAVLWHPSAHRDWVRLASSYTAGRLPARIATSKAKDCSLQCPCIVSSSASSISERGRPWAMAEPSQRADR